VLRATVKSHLLHIFAKFGIDCRSELAADAISAESSCSYHAAADSRKIIPRSARISTNWSMFGLQFVVMLQPWIRQQLQRRWFPDDVSFELCSRSAL
jgi:hypothetical protein